MGLLALSVGFALGLARSNRAEAEGIPTSPALHYSGALSDNGQPFSGRNAITISLWTTERVGTGTKVCEKLEPAALIEAGRFRVALGEDCLAGVRANPNLWVETVVDGTNHGRRRLGAVPYAVEAERAADATGHIRPKSVTANPETGSGQLVLRGSRDPGDGGRIDLHGASHATTPDAIIFRTAGQERMRVASSGSVGIGTADPAGDKLTISGGIRLDRSEDRRISFMAPAAAYQLGYSGGAAILFDGIPEGEEIAFETHFGGHHHAERMRISKDGNVGIGTGQPVARLDVTGSGQPILDITTTGGPGDNSNPVLRVFGDLPKDKVDPILAVTRAGRVGINTGGPVAALDVNGKVQISGPVSSKAKEATLVVTGGTDVSAAKLVTLEAPWEAYHTDRNFVVGSDRTNVQFHIRGDGEYFRSSSRTLKKDVRTIEGSLDLVSRMEGVYYRLKSGDPTRKTGFIAEDLGAVLPEAVDGDKKQVAYTAVVPVLVEAIKELQKSNAALEARLKRAETQLAASRAGHPRAE